MNQKSQVVPPLRNTSSYSPEFGYNIEAQTSIQIVALTSFISIWRIQSMLVHYILINMLTNFNEQTASLKCIYTCMSLTVLLECFIM